MAEIDKEKIGQLFNKIQSNRQPVEIDTAKLQALFNEIQNNALKAQEKVESVVEKTADTLTATIDVTKLTENKTEIFTVDDDTKTVEETKQYIIKDDKKDKTETKAELVEEKPVKKKKLHWLTKLMIFVDICAAICFFVVYGPIDTFRNWFVTTACSTASHRYFAYTFYSKDYVSGIISQYKRIQTETNTDVDAIKFVVHDENEGYSSIYEEQILKKNNKDDSYKIIEISEDKYSGYIAVVYEPQRLNLAQYPGNRGYVVSKYCKENNCLFATNAGPANVLDGYYYPYNTIIADGKLVYSVEGTTQIIGMNDDGVLCLLTTTSQEAVDKYGLKWGVSFGPFLIVNGVKTQFKGSGGYGVHPRTAIGQRQDGIILIFIIDGRGGGGSSGISMPDLTDLMARYGCYNAANLDGGGSTVLAEKGTVINHPVSYQYAHERRVMNVLYYK